MKILVYGAGPLGSLFAARLHRAGHAVSLLARGQRLADLWEYGVVLVNFQTGEETVTRLPVIERLEPEDRYELVLVIMRKNCVRDVLPALAANHVTPNVLFLMNNAAGPDEFAQALDAERVLVGFPMAAGYREGHAVHYLAAEAGEPPARIPFGEMDGRVLPRTEQIAQVLSSMDGFAAEIRPDMDAWLKTHVALLMPSIAPALAAAGGDRLRLARTRDLIAMAVRAVREGFQVLYTLGVPITPASLQRLALLPEPLLVGLLQRRFAHPLMHVALEEHARSAGDEIKHLADEFLALARKTQVPTPNIDRLYQYFDPQTPLYPDGDAKIPLQWMGVWQGLAGAASLLAVIGISAQILRHRRK